MDFIEYVKEMVKKVENEHGVCRVKMGDDDFFFHDNCFCDFHKDFIIMYDKSSDVSIVTRYDAIQTLQYMPKDKLDEMRKKAMGDIGKGLIESLFDGLDD